MQFLSTRGVSPPADLRTALFQGLAPDGGLYLPERYPELTTLSRLRGASREENAAAVLGPFLEEIPASELRQLIGEALNFDIPLVELEKGIGVLELFHGPTLAFKDVGARVMARLMRRFLVDSEGDLTILVATSGDTGSAVAHAFLGLPGIAVVILYPRGKVSELQEKQFTTLEQNVTALAVEGTFDDCQRIVKAAFGDAELRAEQRLTSANSINIGRRLPQAFYYLHAWSRLSSPSRVVFSAPSGNFGNLCGGLIAKRMGMPCDRFVAATNVNDVVPEYLRTGEFRPRESIPTISNAMDVGDPSNFARILSLYGGDIDAIRADIAGSRHSDDRTRDAIREVFDRTGYVLDPHSAVGYLGLREVLPSVPGAEGILIATAHPAKFREEIESVIGEGITLPKALSRCLSRRSRALPLRADDRELKRFLRERG